MHHPTSDHWTVVKYLLWYLCSISNHGLVLYRNSFLSFHVFSNANWAHNKDNFNSTSAYIVYLGRNPILQSSKKQRTVARASTEVEYCPVAHTSTELCWIYSFLTKLGFYVSQISMIYCNNVRVTHLCSNLVFHSRMKHVALDYRFIHEQVQSNALHGAHVSSKDQLIDALTKPFCMHDFSFIKPRLDSPLKAASCGGLIEKINNLNVYP